MKKALHRLQAGWRKKSRTERVSAVLIAAGILLVLYYLFANWVPKWYRQLTYAENLDMTQTGEHYVPLPVYSDTENYYQFTYPTDSLFSTDERRQYQSGELTLRVPRLGLTAKVVNGTRAADLKKGPGLYQCSAMPSYGNPNVCIAAHRGVYGAEFYYLDKLTDGDLIYLEYDNYLFTYEYVFTATVPADDWSLMYCTDYSAITLTTCELTNSTDRICVRGKLQSVVPMEGAASVSPDGESDAAAASGSASASLGDASSASGSSSASSGGASPSLSSHSAGSSGASSESGS